MTPAIHAPHAHAPMTVGRVMATVMLALVPATLYGFWLYGWPAIFLWLVALATALATEALTIRLQDRPVKPALLDGSGLLTAWLLVLSLPPWAPWWIAAVGSAFAVVVAKQVFGGLGQNVFNPAMAARVMLLISFPVEMTAWVRPAPMTSEAAPDLARSLDITFAGQGLDAMTGASLLGHVKTELGRGLELGPVLADAYQPDLMLMGSRVGSLGETAALLILLGGLFLILRGIITWHGPVAMLLGVALPALVAWLVAPHIYPDPLYHLLAGGVMLAAFFIITDPVTSPNSPWGLFAFGLGVGLLTWIIRTWGGYPEGVAFAVLLMNAATPVIDRYLKPRIYGRDRRGRPHPAKEA